MGHGEGEARACGHDRSPAFGDRIASSCMPRRGGRAVECDGLENRWAGNPRPEGSNPSPSARWSDIPGLAGVLEPLRALEVASGQAGPRDRWKRLIGGEDCRVLVAARCPPGSAPSGVREGLPVHSGAAEAPSDPPRAEPLSRGAASFGGVQIRCHLGSCRPAAGRGPPAVPALQCCSSTSRGRRTETAPEERVSQAVGSGGSGGRGGKGEAAFISYRRGATTGQARALREHLVTRLGRERVFMDVDNIALGEDFVAQISMAIASSGVMLALIGSDWLLGEQGERHFDNPEDFIRLELASAFEHELPVIPILVERTAMPARADLPEPLWPLLRRQALDLENSHWEYDVGSCSRRSRTGSACRRRARTPSPHRRLRRRPGPPARPRPSRPVSRPRRPVPPVRRASQPGRLGGAPPRTASADWAAPGGDRDRHSSRPRCSRPPSSWRRSSRRVEERRSRRP